MADIVSKTKRSKMMAGIKGKNTQPEILIRKSLFHRGYGYRKNVAYLPGKPDIVLSKYKAVIFVHGCFWHGHQCHLFRWPSTRPDFWKQKIHKNCTRDQINETMLLNDGWRILTIWECAIKGKAKHNIDDVISMAVSWLASDISYMEIKGKDVDDCIRLDG